jgi:hypothetical protein
MERGGSGSATASTVRRHSPSQAEENGPEVRGPPRRAPTGPASVKPKGGLPPEQEGSFSARPTSVPTTHPQTSRHLTKLAGIVIDGQTCGRPMRHAEKILKALIVIAVDYDQLRASQRIPAPGLAS